MQQAKLRRFVNIFLFMFAGVSIVLALISVADYISVCGLKLLSQYLIPKDARVAGWIAYHFDENNYIVSFWIFKIPKVLMFFIIIIHFVFALMIFVAIFLWNYGTYIAIATIVSFSIGIFWCLYTTNESLPFDGGEEISVPAEDAV